MKEPTVKNLKETLVNYSGTAAGFDHIYEVFEDMAFLGFIDRDTWNKFNAECCGWYVTHDGCEVRDAKHNNQLVFSYSSAEPEYIAR